MDTTNGSEGVVVTVLPIPRDAIEHPSEAAREEFEKNVARFAALCVKEGRLRKITLTISGYEDDPRELYEIPEVCDWARTTLELLPSLPFFLDGNSQYAFVGWLCGPVSRKESKTRQFANRFQETRKNCVSDAIAASSEFLERAGASKKMISAFYMMGVRELAEGPARGKK
jgi:hypothetical protein